MRGFVPDQQRWGHLDAPEVAVMLHGQMPGGAVGCRTLCPARHRPPPLRGAGWRVGAVARARRQRDSLPPAPTGSRHLGGAEPGSRQAALTSLPQRENRIFPELLCARQSK